MKISDLLVEGQFAKNLYYQVDSNDKNSALKVQQHFPFYPTKTEGIWKCPIMKNESFQTQQKKQQILNHLFTPINDIKKHLKNLKEFAIDDNGGDGGEEDGEEILRQLAKQWWLGSEQDMIRAERTLASMGWEIGEDSGYDNGGVFVVRAGDMHGKSYISWPHEDLEN